MADRGESECILEVFTALGVLKERSVMYMSGFAF